VTLRKVDLTISNLIITEEKINFNRIFNESDVSKPFSL